MRKLVDVLVALAALCFVLGVAASFLGEGFFSYLTRGLLPAFSPEGYWRGTTALLLFAITVMLRERGKG